MLGLAGVAAVFPLFALSYGVRARNYGLLLLFVALCLLLAIRLAWDHRRWYDQERPDLFASALRAVKSALNPGWLLNPGVLIDP